MLRILRHTKPNIVDKKISPVQKNQMPISQSSRQKRAKHGIKNHPIMIGNSQYRAGISLLIAEQKITKNKTGQDSEPSRLFCRGGQKAHSDSYATVPKKSTAHC